MSTILKALRRLEQEKAAAAPRELREELAAAPLVRRRSRPRRWLPAAALLAGLGLVGAWWGWPHGDGEPTASVAQVEEPAAPAPAVRVSVEPGIEKRAVVPTALVTVSADPPEASPAAGLPEQAFSSPVEIVSRPAAKPRIPMEEPAAPTTRAPQPQVARADVAETPDPLPGVAPADPPRETPAARPPRTRRLARTPTPKPTPVPAAAAPDPQPQPPATAVPETAPTRIRASAPPAPAAPSEPAAPPSVALRVEKTLWHPRPERREALVAVDGDPARLVHEGDVVGRSLVSEIQPLGVGFERDGETLRRSVGDD